MCALPIGRFRSEVARLREQAETTESQPSVLRPALRRLGDLVEELQAAAQELEAQNRKLGATVGQLEREQGWAHALGEMAADGCLVTDLVGRVLDANPTAAELTGRPTAALAGAEIEDLVVDEDRLTVRRLLSLGRDRGGGETVRLRRGDQPRRVHVRCRISERAGGEEPLAGWRLSDLERPVFVAERLGVADPVVARRWLAAYAELIALHELPPVLQPVEGGPGSEPDPTVEAQLAHLRARLAFWQRRHSDLSGIELDRGAGQVRYQGRAVDVTRREAELLEFLLLRPGSFFPAQVLLHRAWHASYLSTEQLRSYVVRVRGKLAHLDLPCQLVNRRSRGYALLFPAGAPVPALHVVGDHDRPGA